MVLLVPRGLTITKVGDQLVIQRDGVAVATHAIEVQPADGERAQPDAEGTAARTPVEEETGMPMTGHQQEVLASEPEQAPQQTAPEGTAMPSTTHQREALAAGEHPGQEAAGQARGGGEPGILREALVVSPAIAADNGMIHVINAVLLPADVLKTLEEGQG